MSASYGRTHPVCGNFRTATPLASWLAVHYGGAVLFPLMALVIWQLIRDLPGRAATVARVALLVYGLYEALVGIATGIAADAGSAATAYLIERRPLPALAAA